MILATLRNKKLYKIVTIAVSLVFLGSIVAVALVSGGTASAAASSNIGTVDYQKVVTSSPSYQAYVDQMQVEEAKTKQDFDQNSAKMTDKEKEAYFNQLKQRLQTKQQDLLKGVIEKVNGIIKTVAEDKGISAVLDKSQVFYGGTDITDDVLKKIAGK
ncbi:MAG: OmpH family outer membrane protein [Negativicutes bacterium]